eukprot:652698-Prorocentrum_minimum.AAC.1
MSFRRESSRTLSSSLHPGTPPVLQSTLRAPRVCNLELGIDTSHHQAPNSRRVTAGLVGTQPNALRAANKHNVRGSKRPTPPHNPGRPPHIGRETTRTTLPVATNSSRIDPSSGSHRLRGQASHPGSRTEPHRCDREVHTRSDRKEPEKKSGVARSRGGHVSRGSQKSDGSLREDRGPQAGRGSRPSGSTSRPSECDHAMHDQDESAAAYMAALDVVERYSNSTDIANNLSRAVYPALAGGWSVGRPTLSGWGPQGFPWLHSDSNGDRAAALGGYPESGARRMPPCGGGEHDLRGRARHGH